MKYREAVIIQRYGGCFFGGKIYSEKIKTIFVTYLLHFFDFGFSLC